MSHELRRPGTRPDEPVFNVPPVLVVLIAIMAVIHVGREYLLNADQDLDLLVRVAFIPARYDPAFLQSGGFPGGLGAQIWTFVTYAFLHGDWMHLGVNCIWLLPFGAAVARRFGNARFLLLFAVTAAGGALAHLVTHLGQIYPMIGASGAVSGMMAAAMRFAFQHGGPLESWRRPDPRSYTVPAEPLMEALRNPRVLIFIVVWFVLNLIFGIGSKIVPGSEADIAWQAHVGGFLTGLLLFPLFDPVPPRRGDDDRVAA
jgi:membrane associated rhomboid family serine protease